MSIEGEWPDDSVIARERCPACSASGGDWDGDNLARYADGHGHCFACGWHENPNSKGGSRKMTVKASAGLLPTGEFKRLALRGISEETCRKFGYFITVHPHGTTIQVEPYYNATGELVAQHTRDAAKNFRWLGDSRAGLLFGQQLWGSGGRRVILTEGAIDCLSISQIQGNKWPVVSIKSGAQGAANDIKGALEWLESYQEIVFCFDMDEPGRAAAQKCAALISPGKAKIAHLPLKDANECLMNGKVAELTQALWNAKPYRPDGIVNIKDLKEKSRRSVPYGATFQYAELCEAIKGVRGGELILFTAGSGVGKSTIVHEIGYELNQKHGWPLGVLALEESTGKTARRYVGISLNLPLVTPGCTVPDDEYDAAFDALAAREDIWFYDHFGSTDIDGILSKLRYLAVSCGAKAIILDHISIVVSGLDEAAGGETERKTIDKLMTRLRSLVEETQVAVLAVVHLKRPPDKGKSWNEGREPALTDLRGSGALEQLSDVVVALGRDQQGDNPNLARIRVLKNRPVGLTGAAGLAEYNPATGRLLPAMAAGADCPFDGEDNDNDKQQPDF